jgi:hypothetical protein
MTTVRRSASYSDARSLSRSADLQVRDLLLRPSRLRQAFHHAQRMLPHSQLSGQISLRTDYLVATGRKDGNVRVYLCHVRRRPILNVFVC